ncbi:MAG: nitroreductase family protein [Chitinophagaceae bacterium]|nr:nitroreductase family protein [Anaerolineae bacterium]
MNVNEAIQTRRAVRLFSDQPVPEDIMHEILQAGGRAQSSKNTQPWQFVVVRDRDTLKALSQMGDFAGHLAGADFAVCLVGSAPTHWNSFDLGQAAAQLQLAAWDLGVGSCIAAIYQPDAAKTLLGIPADSNFYAAISFGYPSSEHKPFKMGGRKSLDDLVRWEKW